MKPFWNYFWTAQLVAGLALSAKTGIEGYRDYGFWIGLLWALAGFVAVLPIAAAVAAARVAYESRRERRPAGSPDRRE